MKKLITFIFIFCAFTTFAENAKEEVLNVRGELGLFLNENTKFLKENFQIVEKDLTGSEESLKSLKRIAESFRLRSTSPEVNPTLLKQGKEKIPECDYTKEDLEWKDNSWFCRKVEYAQDCEPTDDEKPINSGEDIVCVLKGNYRFMDAGWGLCNPATGVQKSKYKCMYIDSKGLAKYEVPDSKCGTKPEEKEYNCWGVWEADPWEECSIGPIKTCTEQRCYVKTVSGGRSITRGTLGYTEHYYIKPSDIGKLSGYLRGLVYCGYQNYNCATPTSFIQTREVKCSKKYCDSTEKPESEKTCPPIYGTWSSGAFTSFGNYYSTCGSHCDGGGHLERRTVRCSTSLCNPSKRPQFLRHYTWKRLAHP